MALVVLSFLRGQAGVLPLVLLGHHLQIEDLPLGLKPDIYPGDILATFGHSLVNLIPVNGGGDSDGADICPEVFGGYVGDAFELRLWWCLLPAVSGCLGFEESGLFLQAVDVNDPLPLGLDLLVVVDELLPEGLVGSLQRRCDKREGGVDPLGVFQKRRFVVPPLLLDGFLQVGYLLGWRANLALLSRCFGVPDLNSRHAMCCLGVLSMIDNHSVYHFVTHAPPSETLLR